MNNNTIAGNINSSVPNMKPLTNKSASPIVDNYSSNDESDLKMFRERDRETKADLKEIQSRFINKDFNIDDAYADPELFTRLFLSAHPNFERALKERAPSVSQHDTLLCILIVLDVPKEEVARVLKIRPDSINVARHRLRKRLNLTREENLFTWLRTLL